MQAGYAVVFLSRKGSLQPYLQHLPRRTEGADVVAYLNAQHSVQQGQSGIQLCPDHIAAAAQAALSEGRLLTVHYNSVFEYLCFLEVIAKAVTVRSAASQLMR